MHSASPTCGRSACRESCAVGDTANTFSVGLNAEFDGPVSLGVSGRVVHHPLATGDGHA
jgi:hypothetical protein